MRHYRRHWEESFERLDDYPQELQAREKKHGGDKDCEPVNFQMTVTFAE